MKKLTCNCRAVAFAKAIFLRFCTLFRIVSLQNLYSKLKGNSGKIDSKKKKKELYQCSSRVLNSIIYLSRCQLRNEHI